MDRGSFQLHHFAMTETTTHQGGCHCGKVRFEVSLDLTKPVIACNCSMCQRAGTLLSFVPVAQFKLLSGESELTDYKFNKHVIHHWFCKTCGVKSFAGGVSRDGGETRAINVRCLDDVDDVRKLDMQWYDGRHA